MDLREIFSNLENNWLSRCQDRKIRILSIDGGGTNCIVAGAALVYLEDQIQAKTGDSNSRISDFFDLVAGTGIGAIFAAMITADDGDGRPMFTAREAFRFFEDKRVEIFKPRRSGLLRRRRGFSGKAMEKALKKALRRDGGGALTLKDTCKPILVPCFDLNTSAPFVFSRAGASESPSFDFELWKVCRASSANPSVFDPFPLTSVNGKTSCVSIDGGLVMNNPSAAAVTHVLYNKRDFPAVNGVGDLALLSLGNGVGSSYHPGHGNGGKVSTASVVDIVLDGVSETVDQMLATAFRWNPADYVRIQGNGFRPETAEQVVAQRGLEWLPPLGGKRMATETNGERIQKFVGLLVASTKKTYPVTAVR